MAKKAKVGTRGYKFDSFEAEREKARTKLEDAKTIELSETLSISKKNHDILLQYFKYRLDEAKQLHDPLVDRYEAIDKQYFNYIKLSDEDKEREQENLRGEGPKAVNVSLPLVSTQVDDSVSFALSVIAPDTGMYQAAAGRHEQNKANGIVKLMNIHAEDFGHYLAWNTAMTHAHRYNFGGVLVTWKRVRGTNVKSDPSGFRFVNKDFIKTGNMIVPIDPYNFLYDMSCPAVNLNREGEFAAMVNIISPFKLRKMQNDGEVYNSFDKFVAFDRDTGRYKFVNGMDTFTYFRAKPNVHNDNTGRGNMVDWSSWLSNGQMISGDSGIECIHYFTSIVPKDFGLGDSEDSEIWKFVILGNTHICYAARLDNAHGLLPFAISVPLDTGFAEQEKSIAEKLLPYQNFASFQMNVHQHAARKSLYGITIYDEDVFGDLSQIDAISAKIPAKPNRNGVPLRESMHQFRDAPETKNTMTDIAAVGEIMQKILPTDLLKNITGLDRATMYQAAATVHSGNKKSYKITKIMSIQMLAPARHMQVYNIMQYQDAVTIINDETGEEEPFIPAEIQDARIEFAISDGLKAIDKMLVIENLKEVINTMIQSQTAIEQIDVVGIMDYWMNLIGEKYDFTQFKYKSPMDALPPEQRTQAFQVYQQFLQMQEAAAKGKPANGAAPGAPQAGSTFGGGGIMPNQPLS